MLYRTKKITVRLTDKEYAKLREMSETSGLKMEPVIRKLLVGCERNRENYRGPVERNASASGKDMGFLRV